MADFSWINTRLATGAAITTPEDAQAIIDAGITHVIDCRAEFDDLAILAVHPQVSYLYNGVEDDGQPKPTSWFGKSIEFALPAFVQSHTRIYSHCAAGINRGPSTAYAILRSLGFSSASAEAFIRSARPQVGLAYKTDADRAVTELGFT